MSQQHQPAAINGPDHTASHSDDSVFSAASIAPAAEADLQSLKEAIQSHITSS